jgi:hypothetical protein
MYLAIILLLMLILPVGSIAIEHFWLPGAASVTMLTGKWFAFWTAGVRLVLAGVRQFFQPRFTAEQIFSLSSPETWIIVRELGIANFSSGAVGMLCLRWPEFALPVAINSAIFYGIAGVQHLTKRDRSAKQTVAMLSDLFAALVFVGYVVARAWQ